MKPTSALPESPKHVPEKAKSNPLSQDDSACRYSFSTDSDEDEDDPPQRVRHDDHWDRLLDGNIWDSDPNEWTWYNSWVERGSRNKTNAQLEEQKTIQEWRKKLPLIQKNTILKSTLDIDERNASVPLFIGDNGDEYQIYLTIAYGAYGISLPHLRCPAALLGSIQNRARGYFELKARITDAKSESEAPMYAFPKYALCIGVLRVRTLARSNFPAFAKDGPLTETTDFEVIVDLQHDDMPLWIVAHRQQLLARPKKGGSPVRPPLLPIFDGLMTTSEHEPYDIACILPSIRHLANRKPDAEPPSYKETCELVRNTRAMVDPICFVLHEAEVEKFLRGEEAPKPAPPKTSHLAGIRGGASKLWTFFRGNR